MKYLKRFNESTEDLETKIRECFSGVSDMDINIRFDGYTLPGGKDYDYKGRVVKFSTWKVTSIEINLNNKTTGQDAISKWGVRYNPVVNGQEIAFEISNAIQHCFGEDLNIKWAEVKWKNAGEWSESGKTGAGPGFLAKAFSKTGTTKQFENPEKGHYNLEDL